MKRTNIMLADDQHALLTEQARTEGKTLGELVRAAVAMAYQNTDTLERRKTIALQAYREGLISLGKLSEILGVDTVSARLYLKKHKVPVRVQDAGDSAKDLRNA